jgi:predicted RNA-binding Zn ribbon-like protein
LVNTALEAHGRRLEAAESLEAINAAVRLAPSVAQLLWTASGPRRISVALGDVAPVDAVLARLAGDAIEMLAGDAGDQLRRCEAPGCGRLFLAEHRRRRWCCRACGDRARVARHYRKHHADGSAQTNA